MIKKLLLTVLCIGFEIFSLNAQVTVVDPFVAKVNQLKSYMNETANYTPEDTDSLQVNEKIGQQLGAILEDPKSVNYDLKKLFGEENLNVTHSVDKRLWIFTWFENTGGSFKSDLSIIQYRTKANKPEIITDGALVMDEEVVDTTKAYFNSNGTGYQKIFKLPNPKRNLYLCLSSMVGCGTCCTEMCEIIELTHNDIRFDYNFYEENQEENQSFFRIDSRCGDITTFEYNPKTKTLSYEYLPDDYTPIRRDEEDTKPNQPVKGAYYWNGTYFIKKTPK